VWFGGFDRQGDENAVAKGDHLQQGKKHNFELGAKSECTWRIKPRHVA